MRLLRTKSLSQAVLISLLIFAIGVFGGVSALAMGSGAQLLLVFAWPAYLFDKIVDLQKVFGVYYVYAGGIISWAVWLGILYIPFLNRELKREDESRK